MTDQSTGNKFSHGQVIVTRDGSHSIAVPASGLTYHSANGAIQESLHVFMEAGLKKAAAEFDHPEIFEMGLGTGLNVLLSVLEAEHLKKPMRYECVELFPLDPLLAAQLNYCALLDRADLQPIFEKIHTCEWEKETALTPFFHFKKSRVALQEYVALHTFNVIYFDAFAPNAQPELWTTCIFDKLYAMLVPGGIFVTYSSKGSVRRNLAAAGFQVKKVPGPPGKWEMVSAKKIPK